MHICEPNAPEGLAAAPVSTPAFEGSAHQAETLPDDRSNLRAPPAAPVRPALRDAIARRAVAELLEGAPGPAQRTLPGDPLGPAATDASAGPAASDPLVDMLIADALLDAGVPPRHPRIEASIRGIMRRYPAEGGTSPRRVAAPDDMADEVAQIAQAMLLLARVGRRDLIAAHCAPPIAILLAYAEADGAIPAWALPERASPDAVAAIAGLVYGLARWDARRFLGMIVAGARWVAERQQPDGSWCPATEGDGLYCSWQALRLLGAVMPNHPAVGRAARFLHEQRHGGGGWGARGREPLTTALAVLALAATRTALPSALPGQVRPLLAPGPTGWPASLFPRSSPATRRTAMGVDGGSPAVTALFALKASEALEPGPRRRL